MARSFQTIQVPCAPGAAVFTIEENYFDCEHCEFIAEAKYRPWLDRASCDKESSRLCPLYVKEHRCEAFTVSEKDGKWELSRPGEWDCEGFSEFTGRDGKHYLSRAEAEVAMEAILQKTKQDSDQKRG